MRSALRSVDPVFVSKYEATVAVKSLKETEGESERESTTEKDDDSHCFAIKLSADW